MRPMEWIHGRPPLVLRKGDLRRWPGRAIEADGGHFAGLGEFAGASLLFLREPEMTAVVPLELGGVLLVTAFYCDSDTAVARHLDFVPVSGWQLHPRRFRSEGGDYVLFDGSLAGGELVDPTIRHTEGESHGGSAEFPLSPGEYDVETLGPWDPDERTKLWLTRLVKSAAGTPSAG